MQDFNVSFPGGKRVVADYRGFRIDTDQPVMGGGDNSAPSPFELFLASLATCAGFYVQSFCQQRDIPTRDIELVQRHVVDERTHMVSGIEIEVKLPADFPAQYRAAVVRAAEQCTVKKHLQNPPAIVVNAVTAEREAVAV